MIKDGLVMAFDFGTKKIGVAIGQSVTGTANPLGVLKARDGIPDWREIQQLINQWQPAHLVIGLPLNMDDSASEMSMRAEKFARRLTGRFNIPHTTVDERLSSFEAKQYQTTDPLDAIAAKLILETYFRSR